MAIRPTRTTSSTGRQPHPVPTGRALLAGALTALVVTAAGAPFPVVVADAGAAPTATADAVSLAAALTCSDLADSLTRSQQIGQLLMPAIGSGGLSAAQERTLARSHAGSVLLLGTSYAGRSSIRRLSSRVHAIGGRPHGVGVLLAVDQEGGLVQRLQGSGFDRIPAARTQASYAPRTLRTRSERWGRQLGAAGVDANLAPVADYVPRGSESTNRPIGALRRGYGPDLAVLATRVPAFVRGMDAAGVATTAKHFPGLGRVRGNTDVQRGVRDGTTTRHGRALRGFTAAVDAGVDMVMVSSAQYTRIDTHHRAVYSPTVLQGMLRHDLGFTGVIISDDLSAVGLSDRPAGRRAVTYLAAGGDLIIVGDLAEVPAMTTAITARAASDTAFRRGLRVKASRVLEMKARRGLVRCS